MNFLLTGNHKIVKSDVLSVESKGKLTPPFLVAPVQVPKFRTKRKSSNVTRVNDKTTIIGVVTLSPRDSIDSSNKFTDVSSIRNQKNLIMNQHFNVLQGGIRITNRKLSVIERGSTPNRNDKFFE